MSIRERISGNEAVAYAMRQINPDVFAAFPITPSTEIPQYFAQYVANGQVDTEYVTVESEHSSMSTCIGAEAAGCRAVTATSSCGLAFMYELLYVASSSRLPITLACVNRALTGPININNDHSDSMGARDAGWIQLYAENNQEAYDNYLQAMRIAETPDVRLPIMVCQDGFITSHAVENIELEEDEAVRKFVGEYNPEHALIGRETPLAVGPYDVSPYYMEHKVQQAEAMKNAKKAILDVAADFEKTFGRKYGFFEEYRMEDAEVAIVLIGSAPPRRASTSCAQPAARSVSSSCACSVRSRARSLQRRSVMSRQSPSWTRARAFPRAAARSMQRPARRATRSRSARSWSISFTVWAAATLRPATSRAYLTTCSCS